MRIADWEVRSIVDAHVALDGGSMFGVVPRALWQRLHPPDERNRIAMVTRLLLIEGRGRRILVDTGLGERWEDRARDIFGIEPVEGGVVARLRSLGIAPEQVTDVILTHLHFDHVAGTVRQTGSGLELTFPHALHHVQRLHWEWAWAPSAKDAGSFRRDDFALLGETEGALHLLDGDSELHPGLSLVSLDGHTRGMQAVRIAGGDEVLLFPSDLLPTAAHLRFPYIMAYDNEPLRTLEEKQRWLARAAAGNWVIALQHDRDVEAVRIEIVDGVPAIRERVRL